ncbi:MAG: DNA repair protein endonuclease SAE2/CtIP C-terminus-domain-containing protein, partial [Lentinula lateritia]
DTAINDIYEIDPAQNAGLEYQYDEVVRGREKRKRLIGGDCDDCREYYEAVGPMPPRLQPPLWKSPVKNSHNPVPLSKRCPHHRDGGTTKKGSNTSNAAHKQNISRHRAAWARGNTPPAYWDIGFPDTQRAEEINESAREMQRKKMEMVEMEAAREGGRYRRK